MRYVYLIILPLKPSSQSELCLAQNRCKKHVFICFLHARRLERFPSWRPREILATSFRLRCPNLKECPAMEQQTLHPDAFKNEHAPSDRGQDYGTCSSCNLCACLGKNNPFGPQEAVVCSRGVDRISNQAWSLPKAVASVWQRCGGVFAQLADPKRLAWHLPVYRKLRCNLTAITRYNNPNQHCLTAFCHAFLRPWPRCFRQGAKSNIVQPSSTIFSE